jgi:hypothetical protein
LADKLLRRGAKKLRAATIFDREWALVETEILCAKVSFANQGQDLIRVYELIVSDVRGGTGDV